MNNLKQNLEEVIQFIEREPKLADGGDLEVLTKRLDNAVNNYLKKSQDIELERRDGYPEAYALLEGEGRIIADISFMNAFAKRNFKEEFKAPNAGATTRKKFLKLAAKYNVLKKLMDELDPNKKFRAEFIEILKLNLDEIESKIRKMTAARRKKLLDKNGIEYAKTQAGNVAMGRKSIDLIISQIKDIKSSKSFYKSK